MKKSPYLFVFVVLFVSASCSEGEKSAKNVDAFSTPLQTDDGWACASPRSAGLDSAKLRIMVNRIHDGGYQNVHNVLIVKDGKLVFEQYFPGYRFNYDAQNFKGEYIDFDANTTHNLASVTKSITSILFGIAIDQGLVKNVDEKLFRFFPEHASLKDSLKDQILLEHLLTMTSGLQWNEQDVFYRESRNDIIQLFMVPDPVRYILSKPIIHKPGTNYYYNGGNTNLLGEIIRKTSGSGLDRFAEKYLFDPLGIKRYKWIHINRDVVYASGDLKLRPRDMAKIGYLMLNSGMWNSQQIVSSGWVKKSTAPFVHFNAKEGYGYQWWTKVYELGNATYRSFSALGWGGQNIVVLPDLDAVIVITGGNYSARAPNDELIYRYIIPGFDQNFKFDYEKIENEAPIGVAFEIIPPSGSIDISLARLSGHWYGRGDYTIPDQLVVEKIDSTEASILYSWGDHPNGYFKKGWVRRIASIDSTGRMHFALDSAMLSFEMDKDEDILIGYYRRGDAFSKLIMNRL